MFNVLLKPIFCKITVSRSLFILHYDFFQYGLMIFPSLWLKIKRITVAIKQKTVARIEPSGPNCPPVNHSAPSILGSAEKDNLL